MFKWFWTIFSLGAPALLIKDSDKLLKQASKSKENKQLNK